MSHTKGPWRQGTEGNMRVYGPDAEGEDSGLIANVFKGHANVELIAAAPDLLAACRELREALAGAMRVLYALGADDAFFAEMRRIGIVDGIGVRADAAIAKAEGE